MQLGHTYPHRCILDLKAAREQTKLATLKMRQSIADTWMNDSGGYDVIALPSGEVTKVFTKREYRLSKHGQPLSPAAQQQQATAGKSGGRGKDRAGEAHDTDRVTKLRRKGSIQNQPCIEQYLPRVGRWRRLSSNSEVNPVIDIDDKTLGA